MKKSIIIDIRPLAKKLMTQTELTLTETIKKHRNSIIKQVQDIINNIRLYDHDITSKVHYKMDVKNRELVITYEWDEQSNINVWLHSINTNLRMIDNHLWAFTDLKSCTKGVE